MAKSYVTRELDTTGDKIATHQTTGVEEIASAILTDDENNALIGQQTKAASLPVTLPSDADDQPVTIVDAAGDSCMDEANDALQVNVVAGAAGGVSHVDDAAFTPGTSSVVPAAGMFDDVSPDAVDEGDAGVFRMSSRREIYTQIRDAAGNERGLNVDASNRIGVDATGAGDVPITLDSEVVAADVTGQGDVPITLDGETVDVSDRAARDLGKVDVAGIDAIGTAAGQVAMTASLPVVIASDQSDVPVTLDSEAVELAEMTLTTISGTVSSSGDNQLIAAPGAGQRIEVVSFTIQNETATATTMTLRSGTTSNGWRWLGQNQGDGLSKDFGVARNWRLNTNEALNLNLSGANSCGYSVMYQTIAVA